MPEWARDPRPRVLLIGSGPIVIGQGAEFDYAGTQAVESLHEEGFEVVLVNPNPATVMTDPNLADRVYLEPLTRESLAAILERERPQGILPTLGGQAGLNLAVALDDQGDLRRLGVEVYGTPLETIRTAEDRARFRALMLKIGEPVPESLAVGSLEQGRRFAEARGLPLVVRPAFTLGGTGGGLVRTPEDLQEVLGRALALSPVHQALLEVSIEGWTELEFEVLRDRSGSAITVCPMENVDAVGVHTGDSIVVAPILTLPDAVVQRMRAAALRIAHALGLVGGCNVQFGVSPDLSRYAVIEVNPRVSRSSALASKATGYPIARIAAKLAVGRTLSDLPNPVALGAPAALEPAVDYVVVKMPRWPFDKFAAARRHLGTEMRATGEAMAIARTFRAAMQKAATAAEIGADGLFHPTRRNLSDAELHAGLRTPHDLRIFDVTEALRRNLGVEEISRESRIAPFFIREIETLVMRERQIAALTRSHPEDPLAGFQAHPALLREAKADGFSDRAIGRLTGRSAIDVAALRDALDIHPVFKRVDTCAAEFESTTPYTYTTYGSESEFPSLSKRAVIVLGGGPIRIGQGIEFDCSAVHALGALAARGVQTVMVNTNPETVSTDASRSDALVFEPITAETVLEAARAAHTNEVLVQFAGQTGVALAAELEKRGLCILGTSAEGIDLAEDRERFDDLLEREGMKRPPGGTARGVDAARRIAREIGFPLMVRPSFVIGGRAMAVVENESDLDAYLVDALSAEKDHPIRLDRYVSGRELELDALADGRDATVCGLFAHIERAGVHSGDSIAVYPAHSVPSSVVDEAVQVTRRLARALRIRGLINLQFVLAEDGTLSILEVNPRASRTVPVLEKATGRPIAAWATALALGADLREIGLEPGLLQPPAHVAVKVPVWSFGHLPLVETALGPEMKSTGEILALGPDLDSAARAAFEAASLWPNRQGSILFTVADRDKADAARVAEDFARAGWLLLATPGTAQALTARGLSVRTVSEVGRGSPDVLDRIARGDVALVVSTMTQGRRPERDGFRIRRLTAEHGVPLFTSLDTAALVGNLVRKAVPLRPPVSLGEYLGQGAAPSVPAVVEEIR